MYNTIEAKFIFLYSIPATWQWTTLENVCECLDNFRSPVNATERAKRFGNIPYYGATGQVGWIDDFLTDEQLVLLGEDLLGEDGDLFSTVLKIKHISSRAKRG